MHTDTYFGGGGGDDSLFGEEAEVSGLERSEPGETQTASRLEPGPILPSPLLHSLAAKVELPDGQTVVRVTVVPGETVELPFAADAQFLVRLGDGNLAIKVGDVTIILQGYAEHPVTIQSADGAPLDIAALLASTDPAIEIETAAGPGDQGGQGADNTGALFQQLGEQGDGADGTSGAAGAQGGTTGPDGGNPGDAGGDPNQPQLQNDLGPVNAAPETSDAQATGLEDAVSIAVPLSGLDSDGFVALFVLTSLPTGGTLYADAALTVLLAVDATVPAVAGAATVYFVPDPNFNGTPTFQYAAIDAAGLQDATPATATITVTPVNDAPVSNDDAIAVDEGGTIIVPVLANDIDADGDPLAVTVVTGPAHGTLVVNPDGTVTYLHDGSETTSDSFTYKTNDGTSDSAVATVSITVNPVNDSPVAVADSYAVNEGGTLTVTAANKVTLNDTDAENDPLTALLVSGPVNGTLTLNSDGTFTYVHNGSETTIDSFSYKANDGTSDGNPVTVTITITPVNDAPIANADTVNVDEGGTATILVGGATSVLNNDSDPEGASLSAILVSGPANGNLFLNGNGTFTYVHNGSETTTDSFTYKTNDGTTDGNTTTVTIRVTPVNDAPSTLDDSYALNEGGTLIVTAVNKLTLNDTDAENDPLSAILVSWPTNGNLTLNPDGTFAYVHDGSETTTDSFTYKTNDGTDDGNTATVTISITPVNDAPVANPDDYTVAEGGTLTVTVANKITLNDADAEGNAFSVELVSGPANGNLALNPDGTFNYTHNGGETATDSFTYKAYDGIAYGNPVTVTINVTPVNDVPVGNPDSYAVDEGGTLTVTAANKVTLNDTDADGDPLTAILVGGPTNGSLTLNPNGTFTYVHDGSETLTDSFTYKTDDGTVDGNTAMVTITVNPVNDAPVTNPDAYTVNEGGTLTVTAANKVTLNDTDAENNPLTAVLVSGPTNGALTLNPDGTFTYIHNGSESTTDSFTYKANDGTTSGFPTTVTIIITPVNDAPAANPDVYSVNEGGTLTVTAADKVTLNDTDAEGNPLTAILVSGTAHGSLTLNADGTFTYVHNGSETLADSFTYKTNDGTTSGNTTTVTITVNPVNDTPVTNPDAYAVIEGGTLTVTAANKVTLNDTDAENNPLTAVLVSGPTNGALTLNPDGTFTYNHNGGETTTDSFTYKTNDGTADGNIATVNITVNPVNDTPVAHDDSVTAYVGGAKVINVLANDTDADLPPDTLTPAVVTGPTHGTLTVNPDGSFTYIHDGGTSTSDSFTYKVNDGAADSGTATVNITVDPNHPPVTVDDSYTVNEGGTLTVTAANKVTLNDTDADNEPLTAILVSGPANGTLTLNQDGTFTYVHNGSETLTDSFTYKANDGAAYGNVATVNITVNPVNDVPVLTVPTLQTLAEDSGPNAILGISVADVDNGANNMAVRLEVGHGTFSFDSLAGLQVGGGGAVFLLQGDLAHINAALAGLHYTPNANYNGPDTLSFKAIDSGSTSSTDITLPITVTPVADAPIANSDNYATGEDQPLTVIPTDGVLANDTDPDGDTLTASLVSDPAHGTLAFNPDGSFTYTPNAGYHGTDSFTYKVNDGTSDGNTATVNIAVQQPNDNDPVANDDNFIGKQGEPYQDNVLTNDTDADLPNDSLFAVLVGSASHGTLSLDSDGGFTYIHGGGVELTDSFTYKIVDEAGHYSNTATVNITIAVPPPNRAPVANIDAIVVAPGGTATQLVSGLPSVLLNDSDADTDPLTAILVDAPSYGSLTLNPDGTFSYIHDGSANLYDSFTYKANDGLADSSAATVFISVQQPNNFFPTAVNDSITLDKGTTAAVLVGGAASVLANDSDMDPGSTLTAVLAVGAAHGSLTLNPDGTFSYTHNGGADLTDSFAYQVSDGLHLSMPAVVTIAITAPPPADLGPTTNADNVFTNFGSTAFQIPEWMLLYNDVGKDATQLDVTGVSGFGLTPPVHTPGIGSDGYVTFTGDFMMLGGGNFTYAATEGGVMGNTATVTVHTQAMIPGLITGSSGQDVLIGTAGADTLNGLGSFSTKGDLIFAGAGDDSIFFHGPSLVPSPIPAAPPISGVPDVVYGGADTVAQDNGLMAGLHGDVLVISDLTVDFTDGFKLDGIEGIRVDTGGMPYPHSITLNASNVIEMSDHSITPGGVFSSQNAVYINATALDNLYLSVSDGGQWSDTGKFATDGVSKIYVHDTTAGTPGNSENAYVIVSPTTVVHPNQEP